MEPYLDPQLTAVIDETPPQTPWDLETMRGEGEHMLGSARLDGSERANGNTAFQPDTGIGDAENASGGEGAGSPSAARTIGANDLARETAALRVLSIPAGSNQTMEIRRFTPARIRAVMMSIHGGGYVAGRARYDDDRNVELANYLEAIVVSPEYRLTPEADIDDAIGDCAQALCYCTDIAAETNLPLYVFGDSAGAGLAFYTLAHCIAAESGENESGGYAHRRLVPDLVGKKPHVAALRASVSGMILFEPCIDPRSSTRSMASHAQGPVWTAQANRSAWALAAPDHAVQARLVETLSSTEILSRFPRTMIVVNPADPLRDEGIELACQLVDSGVEAQAYMPPGSFHGALRVPGSDTWAELRSKMRRFMA
ncbi:MAG: alpha/beta hydrolase fold domain-containing protein [Actinomycetaceae bacterium]|nr:alpha/beta hydrolase [Arcanobacterium sp.]MDD7505273.1 alpha/beta hydrolase fold domain-containing protein [Actinomycetaceae bacterium]MDY6144036.1 alpha/beta hydrolase fold domain-containing protein [Arcanobacterium sp.]